MASEIVKELSDFPLHLQKPLLQHGEILLPVPKGKDMPGLAKRSLPLEDLLNEAIAAASVGDPVRKHISTPSFEGIDPGHPALAKRMKDDDPQRIICSAWQLQQNAGALDPLKNLMGLASHYQCVQYKGLWDKLHSQLVKQRHFGNWSVVPGAYIAGEPSRGVITWDEHGKPTIRKAKPGKEQDKLIQKYGPTRSSVFVDNKELMRPGAPVW